MAETLRRPDDGNLHQLERSLSLIATRARDEIGSCDGLGVTVQLGDDLAFGHCNAFARTVDDVQYGLMEGPCLLAQSTGAQVRSVAIGAGEQRWPRFAPRAAEVGLRSVVSAPLPAPAGPIGSLNLYGTTDGCFSDLEPATVSRVADQVEQAVRHPLLLAVTQANARWFAAAVRDRAEVDRAIGVLMDRYRMGPVEAEVLIEQLALEDGVTLNVAARTVIDQDGA